ncbi:hypothetical protein HS041_27620 [Planomonospora sp. ID67723]|uniref:hypothetical protein n=1 Tax=Planomonospora sp. ID67723 TaxID=2738134 RepID=UPI0018C3D2AC|nr:hypothetical protein [Planomonospora sp. ID67723]MBG0831511.1 hypothetical protein [Planomonospora sp. ID67723]
MERVPDAPPAAGSRLPVAYGRRWWATGINAIGDGAFAAAVPLLAATVTRDPRLPMMVAGASRAVQEGAVNQARGQGFGEHDPVGAVGPAGRREKAFVAGLLVQAGEGVDEPVLPHPLGDAGLGDGGRIGQRVLEPGRDVERKHP